MKLLEGDREVEGLAVPQVRRVQTVTGSSEGEVDVSASSGREEGQRSDIGV